MVTQQVYLQRLHDGRFELYVGDIQIYWGGDRDFEIGPERR